MLGREHAIGHPALTDSHTGLANRLHFELVYSYLFEAGDRGVALTVMLMAAGGEDPEKVEPELLRVLGERVQDTTRSSDLVAHLGHGRYVVLLLGTNLQGGRIAADRVEMALEDMSPTPVSIGLAMYRPEMKEPSELLAAVDRALRMAQEAGGGVELA